MVARRKTGAALRTVTAFADTCTRRANIDPAQKFLNMTFILRRFARESSAERVAHHYNSPAHGPARIFPLRPAARRDKTRAARRAGARGGGRLDARSDAGVPARAQAGRRSRAAFHAAL